MLPALCVSGAGTGVGGVEQATVRIVTAKTNGAFMIVVFLQIETTGKKYITVRSGEQVVA